MSITLRVKEPARSGLGMSSRLSGLRSVWTIFLLMQRAHGHHHDAREGDAFFPAGLRAGLRQFLDESGQRLAALDEFKDLMESTNRSPLRALKKIKESIAIPAQAIVGIDAAF